MEAKNNNAKKAQETKGKTQVSNSNKSQEAKELQKLRKELEQLKKENEKLKNKGFEDFEEAVKVFQQKADIMKKLRQFEDARQKLITQLGNLNAEDDFNARDNKLVITGGFREEITISAKPIIVDTIEYLLGRIDARTEELKQELLKL